MDTKKDTQVAKKEILQDSATTSSTENDTVQRGFYVSLSTYNAARKQMKAEGLDTNAVYNAFLELVKDKKGFAQAVVNKNISITTNNTNYVQRQIDNHSLKDSGTGSSTSDLLHK